jgi:raffinose/stachyose/melibiose transport system permease protein
MIIKEKRSPLMILLEAVIMIFIIVICVYPFIWIIISSLKTNYEIWNRPLGLPTKLAFGNYITAFRLAPIGRFFFNSLFVAVCTIICVFFVYGMAGYALARFKFKGAGIILLLIGFCLLVPGNAFLQPIFLLIQRMGIYDSLLSLIFVYTAFAFPVATFILRGYFLSIPKALEEAAEIDGATPWQTYVKIMMPLAKPAFATVGTLQFLSCWNEFIWALLLTQKTATRTLPLALKYFVTTYGQQFGAMFAAMVIVVLPSVIVFIIFQEKIITGLTGGSVKG